MTPNCGEDYDKLTTPRDLYVVNGVAIPAVGRGTVELEGVLPYGKIIIVQLKRGLHVPQLSSGLFSASEITKEVLS